MAWVLLFGSLQLLALEKRFYIFFFFWSLLMHEHSILSIVTFTFLQDRKDNSRIPILLYLRRSHGV